MPIVHNSQLEAKVAAVNSANALAREIFPQIAALFNANLGKKIVKRNPWNAFTKAFEAQWKALLESESLGRLPSVSLRVSIYDSYMVVTLNTRALYKRFADSESTGDVEFKREFYVSLRHDCIYVSPEDKIVKAPEPVDDFWTVAKVERLEKERAAAAEALRNAEDALGPFRRN